MPHGPGMAANIPPQMGPADHHIPQQAPPPPPPAVVSTISVNAKEFIPASATPVSNSEASFSYFKAEMPQRGPPTFGDMDLENVTMGPRIEVCIPSDAIASRPPD